MPECSIGIVQFELASRMLMDANSAVTSIVGYYYSSNIVNGGASRDDIVGEDKYGTLDMASSRKSDTSGVGWNEVFGLSGGFFYMFRWID